MRRTYFKNFILPLFFILVLGFIFKDRFLPGDKNSSFGVDQEKEITRIEFSEGSQLLVLDKINDNWLVNGEKETRKNSITFILRVLKEIKVKSPVSPEKFNNEIIEKGINPVRVRIYEKSKLLKSFLVYKTSSNVYGNIMKINERSDPFIVFVPGYDINIGSAFILNDLYWQPFTLFNLLPSEIESVSVENYSDTSSSFNISSENKRFIVSDLKTVLDGFDSSLVKRYLTYFTWIPFESWAFDISDPEKEAIESGSPLWKISVTDVSGKKTTLTLWEKEKTEDGINSPDSDRLWGKTTESDEFFIMRYFDVDPVLKKRSYFFPE